MYLTSINKICYLHYLFLWHKCYESFNFPYFHVPPPYIIACSTISKETSSALKSGDYKRANIYIDGSDCKAWSSLTNRFFFPVGSIVQYN